MATPLIKNFIAKALFKKQGAIANNKAVDFSANALEQRIKKFGIDTNAITSENELNQILSAVKQAEDQAFNQQFGNMLAGSKFDKQADVLDMTGKKIEPGSKIMGGKQVEKEPVSENFIDYTIQDINKKEPLEGMKIANKIIKREDEFKDLTEAQSQRILKETDDHLTGKDTDYDPQDFYATGGRIGLKSGMGKAFIEFLKNAGKTMNDKSPVKAYTDYLKSIKDRVKAGKEAEVAGEVIPVAATGALITNQVKKKLKAMNEEQKKDMENKADGGRIGLEGGTNEDFQKYLKERERFEKEKGLEQLFREYKEDLRRQEVGEQKQMAADGGRIGLKGGMTKRGFMKLMGSVGATIGAAKSGIFTGFGKGAGKEVAKEVVQQTTSSMPPPYFFKLAEKIKKLGKDTTPTNDRTIAKSLKSKDGTSDYVLEEDVVTGDVQIKKINMENDNMINDIEIMEFRKGEDVITKEGKAIKTPPEYDEVTESYSRIYKDDYNAPDYQDGIRVDDIIKEVDDTTPSIKYASGGLAFMLGE